MAFIIFFFFLKKLKKVEKTIFWPEIVSVIQRGALKTNCIQNWGYLLSCSPHYLTISQFSNFADRRRQFAITADGTVSIQRQLDRETSPAHQIKILAIDDGDPPKTATATLTVIVQDINDNSPRFLKNYRPVLPEHSPPRKVRTIQGFHQVWYQCIVKATVSGVNLGSSTIPETAAFTIP